MRRPSGGTPIEEAPVWMLAITALLIALPIFPALVGLATAAGLADRFRGGWWPLAPAALVVSVGLVVGLATRKSWTRKPPTRWQDSRPLFVRFSTWLWTAILFPNVLVGLLVLTHSSNEPKLDSRGIYLVCFAVSMVHGAYAFGKRWLDDLRRGPDLPKE
jgi:hypothetical protein